MNHWITRGCQWHVLPGSGAPAYDEVWKPWLTPYSNLETRFNMTREQFTASACPKTSGKASSRGQASTDASVARIRISPRSC